MNENILTWNVENWVTVILMGATFFFLLGLGQKYVQSRKPAASSGS